MPLLHDTRLFALTSFANLRTRRAPSFRSVAPSMALVAVGMLSLSALSTDCSAQRSGWRNRLAQKNLVYKADQKFETEAVRGDGTYSIYLPKDYGDEKQKDTRYPVIYFLHGLNEDHNRFHDRGGAPVLEKAVAEKILPDVIFVCAFDGNRRSFYVNGPRGKVEDMIAVDLVKHVDTEFRTIAERGSRAILGVSMGGFGAMKIAFRHPTMFGILATHSAAVLPERHQDLDEMFPWASRSRLTSSLFGDPVDEKLWKAENPLALARSIEAKKLRSLAIYFDCGDKDRYGLQETNILMHELLTTRKVPHQWSLVKGGNHGWNTRRSDVGYNVANLPNSLRFIGANWAKNKALRGLADGLGGKAANAGKERKVPQLPKGPGK